jgi:hypothetical protein
MGVFNPFFEYHKFLEFISNQQGFWAADKGPENSFLDQNPEKKLNSRNL